MRIAALLVQANPYAAIGVGVIVEVVFVVDAAKRIRQIVLQFIALDLVG